MVSTAVQEFLDEAVGIGGGAPYAGGPAIKAEITAD
jgi:hypothetical protein